jgi:hypothetical protein
MKIIYLLLFCFCGFSSAIAQLWPQQIITNNANGAYRAIPYDLNLDGYTDVISGSLNGVGWYQNIDGIGTFGNEQIIDDSFVSYQYLNLHDLDMDGDMDILYTIYPNGIGWLENVDGLGSFGQGRIIADTDYLYNMSATDIDGDGDLDVFANLYHNSINNRLVWYENIDGLGNFSDENLIEIGDFYVSTLLNFDLDNDGDMDLITSYESYSPSQLIWYENIDGLGNFSSSQEIFQFNYFSDWVSIYNLSHSDLNGDGKVDLIVETYHEDFTNTLVWLENLGQGNFDSPIFIDDTGYGNFESLIANDLDSDGDNDILITLYNSNSSPSIAWYENSNSLGTFNNRRTISNQAIGARDATAADINGDGKINIISASSLDNKIAWYQNGILGISENKEAKFTVHPNPTNNEVYINSEVNIATITLFDNLGRKIKSLQNTKSMSFVELQSGIYFIKITNIEDASETLKVVKL